MGNVKPAFRCALSRNEGDKTTILKNNMEANLKRLVILTRPDIRQKFDGFRGYGQRTIRRTIADDPKLTNDLIKRAFEHVSLKDILEDERVSLEGILKDLGSQ